MKIRHALNISCLVGLVGLLPAPAVWAQVPALVPVQNVMSLSASATTEVTRDVLNLVLSTTREGPEPGAVQAQLTQALDAALAEARKIAKPGQVDVSTGNFSLFPRYAPKGGITNWQGTAELRVDGRDAQAISKLVGRIQTMSVARVGYSLSREAREKVEGDVAAEAIARFRARAEVFAKQFGFGAYTLREVQVSSDEAGHPAPMAMNMRASAAQADALPTEAGKANVTATVSGSVQMK
jgi:predicted secreted protein